MPKFRKKPVVIEAVQLTKRLVMPEWLIKAEEDKLITLYGLSRITRDQPWAEISTLEGTMRADTNDWIIQGVDGEIYPCKPDIFEKTYEVVEKS